MLQATQGESKDRVHGALACICAYIFLCQYQLSFQRWWPWSCMGYEQAHLSFPSPYLGQRLWTTGWWYNDYGDDPGPQGGYIYNKHMLRQTHSSHSQVQMETDGLNQKPYLTLPTCQITVIEPDNLLDDCLLNQRPVQLSMWVVKAFQRIFSGDTRLSRQGHWFLQWGLGKIIFKVIM